MADKVMEKISEDLLHCSICMERYKTPRMLPCIHSFCTDCLEKYLNKLAKETFPCPECRKNIKVPPNGVKMFPLNFYLQNLDEKLNLLEKFTTSEVKNQRCEQCDKDIVVAYCEDCNCAICKSCLDAHSSWRMFREHKTLPVNKLRKNVMQKKISVAKTPKCDFHPTEYLRFFCKTCNKLICRDCTVIEHSKPQHECVEASNQVLEMKQSLKADLQKTRIAMTSCKAYIDSAGTTLNDVAADSKNLSKDLYAEKKKRMRQLEKLLQDEINDILEDIKGTEGLKTKELEILRDEALSWKKRMEKSVQITSKMLEENNMWEILALGGDLHSSFETLEKESADMVIDNSLGHLQKDFSPRTTLTATIGEVIHCIHFSEGPNDMALLVSCEKIFGRIRVGKVPDTSKPDLESVVWSPFIPLVNYDVSKKIVVGSSPAYVVVGYGRNLLVVSTNDFRVQKEITCDNNYLGTDGSEIQDVRYVRDWQYNDRFMICSAPRRLTMIKVPEGSRLLNFAVNESCTPSPGTSVMYGSDYNQQEWSMMSADSRTRGIFQQNNHGNQYFGTVVEKCPEGLISPKCYAIQIGMSIIDRRLNNRSGYRDRDLYTNRNDNGQYQLSSFSNRFTFSVFVLWVSQASFQGPSEAKWRIEEYNSNQSKNHCAYLDGPDGSDVPTGFIAKSNPANRSGMLIITCDSRGKLQTYVRDPLDGNMQNKQEYKIKH